LRPAALGCTRAMLGPSRGQFSASILAAIATARGRGVWSSPSIWSSLVPWVARVSAARSGPRRAAAPFYLPPCLCWPRGAGRPLRVWASRLGARGGGGCRWGAAPPAYPRANSGSARPCGRPAALFADSARRCLVRHRAGQRHPSGIAREPFVGFSRILGSAWLAGGSLRRPAAGPRALARVWPTTRTACGGPGAPARVWVALGARARGRRRASSLSGRLSGPVPSHMFPAFPPLLFLCLPPTARFPLCCSGWRLRALW